MGMPLAELCERMSAAEFMLHWLQYLRQPWGPERDELNTALLAHTVANSAGKVLRKETKLETYMTYGRKKAAGETPPEELDPLEVARRYGK